MNLKVGTPDMNEEPVSNNQEQLKSIFITESFKSKSEALKQSVIYVFCPEECASNIGEIIDDYSFDIIINDYRITDFTKKSSMPLSKCTFK